MSRWIAVNHEREFLFFFNAKCACTSIKHWFNRTLSEPSEDIEKEIGRYGLRIDQVERFEAYRRIFFVRDPLRRLVSFYAKWMIEYPGHHDHAALGRRVDLRGQTFREFVHTLRRLWLDGIPFQHHLAPQTSQVCGLPFDHVVRVEHFDDETRRLSRILGVPPPAERRMVTEYDETLREPVCDLPPDAFGAGTPTFEHFYDDELRGMAEEIYRDDLLYHARARFEGDRRDTRRT